MLAETAARMPEKAAIIFRDQRTTYHEFDRRANQVANGLNALGIQPGDRVGLYLHNIPLFMEAYYGILRAGAAVVPMNPLYKAQEVEYILRDCGATAILTFGPFAPVAIQAASAAGVPHVVVAAPDEIAGAQAWATVFGEAPETPPSVPVSADDVAVLPYTSGTTGRPKGAMLTHGNLLANCEQCSQVERIKPSTEDVVWIALPLFHIYAMNVGMNLGVMHGATLALIERFEPVSSLQAIQQYRCTILYGAPPMFVAWSQMPNLRDYDLSSVRYIASGAAALPVRILELFEGLAGVPISEGYGLTEASPVVTSNAAGPVTKPGTVGPPIPGVEVRIVDENSNEVPRGQPGELICRGANIMKGYWRQPEATAEALRDGWLYTGDIATMDEDGYCAIVDRKKDMIIVSGFNVYPREVEEALFRHPAVAEAAVVAYPDPYQGESVLAFIVPKPGEHPTEQEIIDYAREQLAVFKCPRKVLFRDALPLNNTGKVLRRQLRDEARQFADSDQ
jgi:long-chain acyl-CoA synthetase